MTMLLSDSTLKRMMRRDQILRCLGDYRDPTWSPSTVEKEAAAKFIDGDMSAADAAEMIQANL